jgi:hypothetical protein
MINLGKDRYLSMMHYVCIKPLYAIPLICIILGYMCQLKMNLNLKIWKTQVNKYVKIYVECICTYITLNFEKIHSLS